jgi:hypothetical protein
VQIDDGDAGTAGTNYLLGIVNGWFPDYEPGSRHHGLNTGITAVLPAARIAEILDSEKHVWIREEIVKRLNEDKPTVRKASLTNPKGEQNEEFDQFEKLARQLVHTPKPAKEPEGE